MGTKKTTGASSLSRRHFVKNCSLVALGLKSGPLLALLAPFSPAGPGGAAGQRFPLDGGWLFAPGALSAPTAPAAFQSVTLPHCVTPLSWQDWKAEAWQQLWLYRRPFTLPPEIKGLRAFVQFDGVMVGAQPLINGHALPKHLGGYLPFEYEITPWLKDGGNTLEVEVDSRWSAVPPQGSPKGANRVDYLEPGGIHRPVWLHLVPQVFIRDVFAKPVRVLEEDRAIEVACTLDTAMALSTPLRVQVELKEGDRVVARTEESFRPAKAAQHQLSLRLSRLRNVALWHTEAPRLYQVVTTLFIEDKAVHNHAVRIGLREARFDTDGFFLNGSRLQLFGLNRHELYPYTGYAMPARVMRRDAEILRRELNCNIVRCSHYPQSPAFLDACDELGLLVWEEAPGWQYLGDEAWKDLFVRDVRDMVVRDRNHPSIVIWGVRVNESPNDPVLYRRTKNAAKALDDSRPTSGSMTPAAIRTWREDWHQEVLAFDDYHSAPDGTVAMRPPDKGVPYLAAEAVGQFNYTAKKGFTCIYRRSTDAAVQSLQALRHAQAHSKAAAYPNHSGVIAWCAFEYGSLVNPYRGVKYPGVCDVFRLPKLGASFYLAQVSPSVRPVIEPNFYWDFGPRTPRGPGKQASLFSNCERLEVFVDKKHHATLLPDKANYPHVAYPPFFVDLDLDGRQHPELEVRGYTGTKLLLTRRFSSHAAKDQFRVQADDRELVADGSDATRLVFRITDRYGAPRPFAGGTVDLQLQGPGVLVGDNPFLLEESGGAGAVWIKTLSNKTGVITVTARHSLLGAQTIQVLAQPPRERSYEL